MTEEMTTTTTTDATTTTAAEAEAWTPKELAKAMSKMTPEAIQQAFLECNAIIAGADTEAEESDDE